MRKLNLLLVLALVASSMWLVRTSYEARRLYGELHFAESEQERLDTEYRRIDADRQQQANSLQIARAAQQRLQMRRPLPGHIFSTADAVVPVAAAGSAAAGLGVRP